MVIAQIEWEFLTFSRTINKTDSMDLVEAKTTTTNMRIN